MENNPSEKIHNERGAGRKSKATDEIFEEVLRLYNAGYSRSQIANFISHNIGTQISKSTIHKILKDYQEMNGY